MSFAQLSARDVNLDFRLSIDSIRDSKKMEPLNRSSVMGLSPDSSMRRSMTLKQKDRDFLRSSMSKCLEQMFVPKVDNLRSQLLAKAITNCLNSQMNYAFRKLNKQTKVIKTFTLGD